ncbi:MAG: helix-turn-helix domain-containing protein [Terracidiphilus sp.]
MSERSKMISKLIKGRDTRESYIRSKLSVLLPAQIRSLRLRRGMKQTELGAEAEMKQGRISVLERIGEVSFSIDTLIKLAAAFRVGLIVKFAPMSEMLAWENSFLPDDFDVVPVEKDGAFINYQSVQSGSHIYNRSWTKTSSCRAFYHSVQAGTENHLATPIEYREIPMGEPYIIQSVGIEVGYPSTAKVGNHAN